jgi:uncharacterized protein (TIGR02145 family)
MKNKILIVTLILFFRFNISAQITDSFIDARDGKKYQLVNINYQTWMAQNLNFESENSWCQSCEIYGRLYNFESALKACPDNWHLPNIDEWNELIKNLGGEVLAGKKIRADNKWHIANTLEPKISSGFNAFPSYYKTTDGKF